MFFSGRNFQNTPPSRVESQGYFISWLPFFQFNEQWAKFINEVQHLTRFIEEATLAYYDPTKEVTVQVDASLTGLGAALLQDKKPMAFASKALMDTESRYTERELLVVVYVCEHFHTYLYGRSFIVESDNKRLAEAAKNVLALTAI